MRYLLPLLFLLAPAAALAGNNVTLASSVFVERVKEDASGKRSTVLEPPRVVTPGDRLLFELSYKNAGAEPAADFVVTNPIPDAVAYAGVEDEGALVSIDQGKSWGTLASFSVRNADGTFRPAQPSDVTHVRWSFSKPIDAGETGKLSFRGVVK
ncbi:MAG TPA: hypothetical protein VGD19_05300 [Allosphingosinicella sp.]|jgi:uncharacterized repeat protein (TIGR01451 family)